LAYYSKRTEESKCRTIRQPSLRLRKQGPCLERKQAVLYRGPFRSVTDDDGHVYRRGERTAVCDKTFRLLAKQPYQGCFETIEPRTEVPVDEATAFACGRPRLRDPRETKGDDYAYTSENASDCCGDGEPCC
jgi:arsenite methyltransferase